MRSAVLHLVILASLVNIVGAQTMRATIAEAEAEGTGFARADPAISAQSLFTGAPLGGSGDRRCVRAISGASLPSGSLRSGDFMIRAAFSYQFEAGKDHKILWDSVARQRRCMALRSSCGPCVSGTLRTRSISVLQVWCTEKKQRAQRTATRVRCSFRMPGSGWCSPLPKMTGVASFSTSRSQLKITVRAIRQSTVSIRGCRVDGSATPRRGAREPY